MKNDLRIKKEFEEFSKTVQKEYIGHIVREN
jgi:hypothetical protein